MCQINGPYKLRMRRGRHSSQICSGERLHFGCDAPRAVFTVPGFLLKENIRRRVRINSPELKTQLFLCFREIGTGMGAPQGATALLKIKNKNEKISSP